jgi:hypothetical protein
VKTLAGLARGVAGACSSVASVPCDARSVVCRVVLCATTRATRGTHMLQASDSSIHASSYPKTLRIYFEQTYRQDLQQYGDHALLLRAMRTEWFYHGAPTIASNASCYRFSNEWSRSYCNDALVQRTLLLLPQNLLMKRLNWYGGWRPAPLPGMCGSSFEPAHAEDHTWVEVLRLGPGFSEGGWYGCWFLSGAGSGIYLNTGRSLRATNRSQLASLLNLNLTTIGRKFLDWNPWRLEHNTRLCEHAHKQGYDTVQIGWEGCGKRGSGPRASEACYHEIISCHPECLALPTPCAAPRQHQSSCARTFCPNCCRVCSQSERDLYAAWNATRWPKVNGPCINSAILRTGWNASLPCVCDDSLQLLNCLGTAPELPAPSTAVLWTGMITSPQQRRFINATHKCSQLHKRAMSRRGRRRVRTTQTVAPNSIGTGTGTGNEAYT